MFAKCKEEGSDTNQIYPECCHLDILCVKSWGSERWEFSFYYRLQIFEQLITTYVLLQAILNGDSNQFWHQNSEYFSKS